MSASDWYHVNTIFDGNFYTYSNLVSSSPRECDQVKTAMHSRNLAETMLKEFGPLMGGEDLRRALGYRTWAAFARAVRANEIGVPVFEIPRRRGRFALTTDVASWLIQLKEKSTNPSATMTEDKTERRDV